MRIFVLLSIIIGLASATASPVNAVSCDTTVSPGPDTPIGNAINSINSSAQSPKTICINPGTYKEKIYIDQPSSTHLTIKATNPNNKPVISGDNYTIPKCKQSLSSPDVCQIKDGIKWRYGALFTIEDVDNVTVQDLEIRESQALGLVFSNSDDSQAIGNYVHSNRMQGITFQKSQQSLAENNIIEANSNINQNSSGGGAGLRFCGVNNGAIRGNISRYNWGEGIIIDCNIGRSTHNLVEDNIIHDNSNLYYYFHASQATIFRNNLTFFSSTNPFDPLKVNTDKFRTWSCIMIQAQEDASYDLSKQKVFGDINTKIYNNVFLGCKQMITLATQAPGAYIENLDIYHNTFVNIGKATQETENKTHFDILLNLSDDSAAIPDVGVGRRIKNVEIKNNIFYWSPGNNQKEISLARNNGQIPTVHFSHNIWSGNPQHSGFNFSNDIKQTNARLVGMDGQGNFPVFTNTKIPGRDISYEQVKNWFKLKSNSPAINASTPVTINSKPITTDYYQSSRSSGSAPDIGAHEFGGTPTTPEPPKWDLNKDNTINILDFSYLLFEFTSKYSFPNLSQFSSAL